MWDHTEVIQLSPLPEWTAEREQRGGEEDISQCQLKVKLMELERAELCRVEKWIWRECDSWLRGRERAPWEEAWRFLPNTLSPMWSSAASRIHRQRAERAFSTPCSAAPAESWSWEADGQTEGQVDRWSAGLVRGSPASLLLPFTVLTCLVLSTSVCVCVCSLVSCQGGNDAASPPFHLLTSLYPRSAFFFSHDLNKMFQMLHRNSQVSPVSSTLLRYQAPSHHTLSVAGWANRPNTFHTIFIQMG